MKTKIKKEKIIEYYSQMNTQLSTYIQKMDPNAHFAKEEFIHFHMVEKKVQTFMELGRKDQKVLELGNDFLQTLWKLRKLELELPDNK